jgi:hypothetical protein
MTEFNRRDRGKFPLIDPRFLEPTSRLPTIPELKVATSNNNYDYSQVFELLKQKRDEAGGIEFMPTETLNDRHLKMLAKNAEKKGNIPPYTVSAPADVVQSAINNLPVEMQTILMPDPVSPIAQSGISDMDTDIDRDIERALAGAMAPPSQCRHSKINGNGASSECGHSRSCNRCCRSSRGQRSTDHGRYYTSRQ